MSYQVAWYILFLPIISFLIISLIVRPFFKDKHNLAGYITMAAIGGSFLLSIWVVATIFMNHGQKLEIPDIEWLVVDNGVNIRIGLLVDSLSAVMLIVVTLVSFLVQIYSQGYMRGDPGYQRYYALMSLFTASMIGLVMADSLFFIYMFWEGVGLCSYLLIGFWFHKPSAANAAKKAFIVTRIGDVGFLLAILYLYLNAGTTNIEQLHEMAKVGALSGAVLTWAALGIFSGAAGKSAQFPLHTWLPDAMEGPTPVSSLIHAATMVAAGVFLVARNLPLFEHSHTAITTVAVIGAFTAIFAASMGLVMNDIKRVVAYSTISQLGYMMLALGSGSVVAGIFHLFNHAFFKCLLFLGAGSVSHTTGTFNMREMGGLRKHMPITYATFFIASLSLAGIWPLSGFWSKDEILLEASNGIPWLFILAVITVFMTAFYIFRALFLTFHGEYKGGTSSAHDSGHGSHGATLHESPLVMLIPMIVLAVLAIFSGWLNVSGLFAEFMGEGHSVGFIENFFGILTHPLPLFSLLVALAGVFMAYSMYATGWISPKAIGRVFSPLYTLFYRKYYMDELYEQIFVKTVLFKGLFRVFELFDKYVVDGSVNGLATMTLYAGQKMRKMQTGQLQMYGFSVLLGLVIILIVFYAIA